MQWVKNWLPRLNVTIQNYIKTLSSNSEYSNDIPANFLDTILKFENVNSFRHSKFNLYLLTAGFVTVYL